MKRMNTEHTNLCQQLLLPLVMAPLYRIIRQLKLLLKYFNTMPLHLKLIKILTGMIQECIHMNKIMENIFSSHMNTVIPFLEGLRNCNFCISLTKI